MDFSIQKIVSHIKPQHFDNYQIQGQPKISKIWILFFRYLAHFWAQWVMMRRMASEAVDNYFADPGKMVTTATVLQCRPVGRSENPLGTISNPNKSFWSTRFSFYSCLNLEGGGHCVLKWGFTWTFPGNQNATLK